MLPNLLSALTETTADLSVTPNSEFLSTTALLDLVAAFSPDAEAFLLDGIDTLATATGAFTLTDGVLEGDLTTASGETLPVLIDGPGILSEAGELLSAAIANLSLADGLVVADLAIDDEIYEVVDFDLATFAADGLSFLLSELDTTIPIEAGQLLLSTETELGLFEGIIDLTGGMLDIDLTTPAGDLDFAIPFEPDDQLLIPTPIAGIDAIVNFATSNIDIPIFGTSFAIPFDTIFGNLELSDGIANLSIDTPFGPIAGEVAIAELVGSTIFDYLTGVSIDAELLDGQLGLLATSGTESFETTVDLAALNAAAIDTLTQTNGDFLLDSGLLTGSASFGEESFDIAETVDSLVDLLTTPFSDLFALSPAAI